MLQQLFQLKIENNVKACENPRIFFRSMDTTNNGNKVVCTSDTWSTLDLYKELLHVNQLISVSFYKGQI